MKLSGTITDLPERDDYDADDRRVADVGIKKPGKGRGAARGAKPTFFRIVFIDDVADDIIDNYAPGDVVTAEVADASVHMVHELDEIGRTAAVIKGNGEAISHGAPRR